MKRYKLADAIGHSPFFSAHVANRSIHIDYFGSNYLLSVADLLYPRTVKTWGIYSTYDNMLVSAKSDLGIDLAVLARLAIWMPS